MNDLQTQLETRSKASTEKIKELQKGRTELSHEKAKILVCVI